MQLDSIFEALKEGKRLNDERSSKLNSNNKWIGKEVFIQTNNEHINVNVVFSTVDDIINFYSGKQTNQHNAEDHAHSAPPSTESAQTPQPPTR